MSISRQDESNLREHRIRGRDLDLSTVGTPPELSRHQAETLGWEIIRLHESPEKHIGIEKDYDPRRANRSISSAVTSSISRSK
jgi:hypothetical protein